MATALREMNPLLGMDVFVGENTGESVTIEAEGGRGVHTRSVRTPDVVAFHLLDFYDPNDLAAGVSIKVRVSGPDGASGQADWAFPFGGGPSLNVGGVPISCRLGGTSAGFAPPAPAVARPSGPPPPPPPG
jgi:hypothetical protein